MRHLAPVLLAVSVLAAPSRLRAEEDAPPAPRMVEIDDGRGGKLAAEVSEPRGGGETKPAVVALHGEGGDHAVWRPLAARLAACGTSFVALDVKPRSADPAAPASWAPAVDDALAAVKWARGTLLANGKKVYLAGCGAGGNAAVAAARRDASVAGALLLGPLPGAGGVEAGLTQWDARPIALVAGAKSPQVAELRKMASPIAKNPRAETLLVDGAAGHGTELLAASPDAVLEAAQWFHGWAARPAFDLKASNVRESSGPGHIVLSQSQIGCGMGGGGGIAVHGQRAPQEIDGVGVLAEPDPAATSLTERSRRLAITPGRAKGSVAVKVERWTGKSWKADGAFELTDCGAFGKDANVALCDVWLSPRVLGVAPFSSVAVKACFLAKGKFDFEDEKPFGGTDLGHFGGTAPERKLFKAADPSTWDKYQLR